MPVYKQLKISFVQDVHLKVPHDTPPLRSFGPLVSRVLELPFSSPWKQLLNILGFGAGSSRFWGICGQFEVDPGWISALDFWCRF
jgi:hypothetical protein